MNKKKPETAPIQYPSVGGCYRRDPVTGELTPDELPILEVPPKDPSAEVPTDTE